MKKKLLTVFIVLVLTILAIIYITIMKKTNERIIKMGDSYILLSATNSNSGIVDGSKDYWKSTNYNLYSDGKLIFFEKYNLSGKKNKKSYKIDKDKMSKIINILEEKFNNYSNDYSASDGDTWNLQYYDENGNVIHEFDGYIYGNKVLEELIDLLQD